VRKKKKKKEREREREREVLLSYLISEHPATCALYHICTKLKRNTQANMWLTSYPSHQTEENVKS
jgi:hypothetical protein